MSKKFWVAFGCVNGALALSAAIAVPTVIAVNNQRVDVTKILNTKNPVGMSNIETVLTDADLYKNVQNKFIENANAVATDDSNLFYVIGNSSSLYKVSPIAHILQVLSQNADKKIFLYVSPSFASTYSLNTIQEAYPNFSYKEVLSLDNNISLDIPSFNISYLDAIKKDIKDNQLESANNKLYAPDLELFIAPFTRYPISTKARAAELWNNYAYLANTFKEINLIPDETLTITKFNNDLYTFYKNNETLSFNQDSSNFTNAIAFQTKLNTLKKEVVITEESSNEKEKYKEFQSMITADRNNALLYVASFLSAGLTEAPNSSFPKINYYLPNTGMIRDANDTTSKNLSLNVSQNEYFAPFDFGGLDIIGLISGLSETDFSLFWNLFKLPESIIGFDKFNGNTNIIFDASLLSNDQIITTEANRIIKILSSQQNLSDTVKLWLKPNANEKDENIEKLKTKVAELSKTLGNGGNESDGENGGNEEGSETVTPPETDNQPSETARAGDTNTDNAADDSTTDSGTNDGDGATGTDPVGPPETTTPTEPIDYSAYIDVLDKTLPIEFLLTAPVLNTAVADTTFDLYLQYSPLYFSIIGNTNGNKQYKIKSIFLTEQQISDIVYNFGDINTGTETDTPSPSASLCFYKDYIWSDEQQDNSQEPSK